MEGLMKEIDTNQDGKASLAELLAEGLGEDPDEAKLLTKEFHLADESGDGYLDLKEMAALIKS